ncbi:MAG: hypothetical protein Q9187_000212 [Circinaria calcarea]
MAAASTESTQAEILAPVTLPRITIEFCTQCKWMLRAAYLGQELLSTFALSLGEVALIPSTGGVFVVDIFYNERGSKFEEDDRNKDARPTGDVTVKSTRVWDRKVEGGFPETKVLKKLVRDIIDPSRDLGHVDGKKKAPTATPMVVNESSDIDMNGTATTAPTSLADFIAQTDTAAREQVAVNAGEKGGIKDVGSRDREVVRNADGSVCEGCR